MSKNIIHLKSPGNWVNDPNGFIYFKGEYHLFYQYFPYAPRWGTMHWGHAVSKDLVHWDHKGIALFPTKYEDQDGCFSGSAIEHDGRMYVYYTGVKYDVTDSEDMHTCQSEQYTSAQMMISSDDGIHFDNFGEKRVIIPVIMDREIGCGMHTRDPKVWRGKDAWFMVLGSTTSDGRGQLLFYKSEDLTDWTLVNRASKEKEFGWMWECPDYFETKGGKVLVISPMGILKDGKRHGDQSICTVVDFEEETCTMDIPDTYQYIDYGLDLYAPQSTVDEEGRRVLVAWLRMPEAVEGKNGKWIGMFCIPRVVEVKNGHIYFRVHPNIKKAYNRRINSASEASDAGYRVTLDISEGESLSIGGYRIWCQGNKICTDRTEVYSEHDDLRMQAASPELKDGCHLDIYVDPNMIEIFINDGEYVISHAVYNLGDEIHSECIEKMELYSG